jgi:hypothetical protein
MRQAPHFVASGGGTNVLSLTDLGIDVDDAIEREIGGAG